jgi:hypothetical protein
LAAIDASKTSFVLVFVDSAAKTYDKLPQSTKQALVEAGNTIPKMAVMDPAMEKSFASINYDALHDARSALRDPKKKAKEYFLAAESAAGSSSAASQKPLEDWVSSDGKAISARFVSLSEGKVSLQLATGATVPVPLDRLAAASQKRAQELAK